MKNVAEWAGISAECLRRLFGQPGPGRNPSCRVGLGLKFGAAGAEPGWAVSGAVKGPERGQGGAGRGLDGTCLRRSLGGAGVGRRPWRGTTGTSPETGRVGSGCSPGSVTVQALSRIRSQKKLLEVSQNFIEFSFIEAERLSKTLRS